MRFELVQGLENNKCRICGKKADLIVTKGFDFIGFKIKQEFYCNDCYRIIKLK